MSKMLFLLCVFILSTFFSLNAAARESKYELHVSLHINGKEVMHPRLYLNNKQKMKISKGKYFLEVMPSEQVSSHKTVLLKFVVGEFLDGKKTILSRAQILALENQKVEVREVSAAEQGKNISIRANAERVP